MEKKRLIDAGETIIEFLDLNELENTTVADLLWCLAEQVDMHSEKDGEGTPKWVGAVMEAMYVPQGTETHVMNVKKLISNL